MLEQTYIKVSIHSQTSPVSAEPERPLLQNHRLQFAHEDKDMSSGLMTIMMFEHMTCCGGALLQEGLEHFTHQMES